MIDMKQKSKKKSGGKSIQRFAAAPAVLPFPPKVVEDLAEIEAFYSGPLEVECQVKRGSTPQPWQFIGRRLTPAESYRVQLLMEVALPPAKIEEGKDEPVYDMGDPDYLKRKDAAMVQARAVAIWLGFPIFKSTAEKAGAKVGNTVEITEFMQNRMLDPEIYDALFAALTRKEVQGYVGFTSGGSFPRG